MTEKGAGEGQSLTDQTGETKNELKWLSISKYLTSMK